MVNIIYGDDNNMLSDEIRALMNEAAHVGIALEFSEELSEEDVYSDNEIAIISVSVAEDDEIREINRDYRGNDKVTDVLSFPQYNGHDEIAERILEDEEGPGCLLGDVVICYDQAVRQAEEYGTGLKRELLYLFVHSLMHLLGYDHEDEEDKKVMRAHEEAVLSKINVLKDQELQEL